MGSLFTGDYPYFVWLFGAVMNQSDDGAQPASPLVRLYGSVPSGIVVVSVRRPAASIIE